MGWDGAGGYTRQHNFSADASAGIKILASRMDVELDDVASAMTIAWARNGQNVPTQNIPMGGRTFINVGAATSVSNFMRVREFIENVPIFMNDVESSADRVSISAQYFTSVSSNQAPGDATRIFVRANSNKSSAVLYLNGHSANVEYQDGNRIGAAMVSGGVYELIFSSVDVAWKLQNPDDGRTALEIAGGVTPTNYQYPPGDSRRYGAIGDGVTDDTVALQNMLVGNSGSNVVIARGTYLISDSLEVYSNNISGGGSREDTIITPNGDFPCFVNTGVEFILGSIRQLTIIYNGGVQPTVASGNDNKIGIYWEIVNGKSPNLFYIEEVEVRGAWYAYYDESASYGCNFNRLFGRDCQNFFFKTAGTTFVMNHVIGLNCNKGIHLNTCVAFVLNGCANDGAVITDGDSVNEFVSCPGLVINGWGAESNEIGGNGACMFRFVDTTGFFAGPYGHANNFVEDSGFVSWVSCSDSYMEFSGHRPEYNAGATELTFEGDGEFYHFLAEDASKITVIGGEFPQPTIVSGSPTLAPGIGTGTARVYFIGATYEGTLGANSFEIINDYTENTGTLTGCTTSPTGTVRASRSDMQVTLYIPQITGTSNTTAATITGAIPAGFRPVRSQNCVAPITDNGATVMALAQIGTNGTITLTSTPAGSATFTGSGTKGIELCSITYSLD